VDKTARRGRALRHRLLAADDGHAV